MAEAIPASLRQADITRFINRANQLRSVKPAVTYWCEYWVVNQILAKQLHNTDDDSLAYTMNLMDQLEKTKTERPDDEAIMDDSVGQAIVEQFAQQTFGRAERVMNANKVTRQTADTFDAAATFYQLLNIWGQPDAETQKKIKFAKWNAARILKAAREGRDPNESNPARDEPEAEVALPSLDPSDPDVQLLTGATSTSASAPRSATVEDDPDAEFYKQQSAAPSAANVPIPRSPNDVELPPSAGSAAQTPGGYFPPTQPRPPSLLSQASGNEGPVLPDVPSAPAQRPEPPSNVPSFRFSRIVSPPPDLPRSPPPEASSPSPPPAEYQAPPPAQPSPPPPAPVQYQPPPPPQSFAPPPVQRAPVPAPVPLPAEDLPVEGDVPGATKHARFAISALNFEDVPTAVKELRAALAALGARP